MPMENKSNAEMTACSWSASLYVPVWFLSSLLLVRWGSASALAEAALRKRCCCPRAPPTNAALGAVRRRRWHGRDSLGTAATDCAKDGHVLRVPRNSLSCCIDAPRIVAVAML